MEEPLELEDDPTIEVETISESSEIEQPEISPLAISEEKRDTENTPILDKLKQAAVAGLASTVIVASAASLTHNTSTNVDGATHPDMLNIKQEQIISPSDTVSSSAEIEDISAPSVHLDKWWHEVEPQSQQSLEYKDKPTQYGCAPTAVSMITDYWHKQNEEFQTRTAQDLLNTNAEQGEFTLGMSPTNIHDELEKMSYTAEDHVNGTFEDLQNAVREGPVLAIVKLGMKSSGNNHAVTVTGIASNGDVYINDPWTGKSQIYSQTDFSKSWGGDFGKDAPRNSFMTVHPKKLL